MRKHWMVLSVSLVAAMALAACSSSGGSKSSGDSGNTGSTGAAGSTAAGSDPTAAGLAAATAVINKYLQPVSLSNILPNQMLTSTPPTGKTIDVMVNGTTSGQDTANGSIAAAKALGWTTVQINQGSTPSSISNAWDLAVHNKPYAVLTSGVPASAYTRQLAELKAEGTLVVTDAVPTEGNSDAPILANVSGTPDFLLRGSLMADWITYDTKGKANVVFYYPTAYPVLATEYQGFKTEFAKVCPKCSQTVQYVPLTSIGTSFPGQVTAYLQSHQSTNYLAMSFGDLALGVPQALKAQNLASKVKIVSADGTSANFSNIAAGDVETMTVAEDLQYTGWKMVDALARASVGETAAQIAAADVSGVLPYQLQTKATIANPKAEYWSSSPNVPSYFTNLWKVG